MIKNKKWLFVVFDLVILALVFWAARYWTSRSFGLYEDDLTIIPGAVSLDIGGVLNLAFQDFVEFDQGRPFHHALILVLSKLGWMITPMQGMYWLGYGLTVVNIALFYGLVRRVADRTLAIFSSLVYVVYAADTTQAYLTCSLGIQPSITFLLLAFHAYTSDRKPLSYFLAGLILFGYETPFPVFIAAPLFAKVSVRRIPSRILIHGLILGSLLVAVFLLRAYVGVGLRDEFGLVDLMFTSVKHMLKGPLISLGSFGIRSIELSRSIDREIGIVLSLSFIVLVGFLLGLPAEKPLKLDGKYFANWRAQHRENEGGVFPPAILLAFAGVVMLIASYALSFTVSTGYLIGRATRVHLPAVLGTSLIVGCFFYLLYRLLSAGKFSWLPRALFALFLAVMIGYGFLIQRDYVLAWRVQQEFWTELLPLISDAEEGTVILVDRTDWHDTAQIDANTWNLPRILNQLYEFPSAIDTESGNYQVPRVYRLKTGWEQFLVTQDGLLQVNGQTVIAPRSSFQEADSSQVIFVVEEAGRLSRRTEPLLIGSLAYPVQQPVHSSLTELPRGILFDYLIVP